MNPMTSELWQRLKPLFHAALEKDTQNRAAFIDSACNGDPELKRHLEQLLEAEQKGTGSLDAPLAHLNGFLKDREVRFQAGELILERFRIIRPIGRGGMGEVYEAEDLQLGAVALKTIRHGIASSSDAFERFRQEVQLARRVSGPQVCRIHELYLLPACGRFETTAFLTMEYLEGITLHEKVHRDGPLPWKEALNVTLEICEGLRLIHEKGIIHRDLKTGNIMLCKQVGSARVVVMDFGLARDFGPDAIEKQESSSQRSGKALPQMIMGTPEYMAPEQFEGKPVSPATDIYALGIILYELVTGLHPYAADTPVAAAIRRAKHPLLPSSFRPRIPAQCDRVIERCLEYDPEKRFQSARDVAKALSAGPANIENLKKDRPWVLWFAFALMLGLVAGSAFFFWQSRQYYRPSVEALRWYDDGVAALREGNNVKATRALQQAISQDNHFVMAHARLAEAWANLDFDGNAQRELLLATPKARTLRPLDRMYLDAIHATVTKDWPTEIKIYRQILEHLPPNQKPSGYVDLGVAYERASEPKHALENYAQAASLDDDNPAPFMHVAVLQSRQHNVAEANRAFQRVQDIFSTEMNQEGLAELNYARGYAANDGGNPQQATQFLLRSLAEAREISSVQLQIRVLTQLSSAASHSDADPQAAEYATQAIRLARENQIDAWAATGLVRLATVRIHQRRFQEAEDSVHEALQIAQQTQQLRVEALANVTLANLMNQTGLTKEVAGPAQAALDYYKKNGYFAPAATASLLLIRAERDRGQYRQALNSANAFLNLANTSGNNELMWQAEDVIGTVYREMEEYPTALSHFERAGDLSKSTRNKAYETVSSANILWKLGRYSESDARLRDVPSNEEFKIWVGEVRASSLLSRGRYREASKLAHGIRSQSPDMLATDRRELDMDSMIAEAHLRPKRQQFASWSDDFKEVKTDDPSSIAKSNLVAAEIDLFGGSPESAYDEARKAAAYYDTTSQLDSELRAVAIATQSTQKLNRVAEYQALSAKIIDIISQIKQTWGSPVSQQYLSRPDLKMIIPMGPERVH